MINKNCQNYRNESLLPIFEKSFNVKKKISTIEKNVSFCEEGLL